MLWFIHWRRARRAECRAILRPRGLSPMTESSRALRALHIAVTPTYGPGDTSVEWSGRDRPAKHRRYQSRLRYCPMWDLHTGCRCEAGIDGEEKS